MIDFVIPTWGKACGIAEYTRSLRQSLEMIGEITSVNTPCSIDGSLRHIQHEYSLFPSVNQVCDLADQAHRSDGHCVMTMHSVMRYPEDHRRMAGALDAIIVHHSTVAELMDYPEAVVIPMGCDPPFVSTADQRQAIRKRFDVPWSPIIASFGFLRSQKGYLEIIEAIRFMKNQYSQIGLVIVAPTHAFGQEQYEEQFFHQLKQLDMDHRVRVIREWLSEDDLLTLLQCASAVVLNYIPSPLGGGISAASKMCLRAQRPLIVTDTIHFIDLDEEVIKTRTPHPADVLAAITAVLEQRGIQDRLAEAGNRFLREHDWLRVAEQHQTLYRQIREETCVRL